KDFFRFLIKRSLRIDPPYIIILILFLLVFNILSNVTSFHGHAIPFKLTEFFAHIFYIVPFTSYKFYDHIFWTLSIEFQFYILIGLLYFISTKYIYRYSFLIIFSLSCFIPPLNNNYYVTNYSPIFAM